MEAVIGTGGTGGGRLRRVPQIALVALLLLELGAALALTDGRLVYTLDDPYIHLAFAEGLGRGHFGLNPGEASAPCSSILWPFLLAPFARLDAALWLPLLLNAACALATLVVVQRALEEALDLEHEPGREPAACVLGLLAIPALNLVGLAFTGMEHSLQVLVAALLARGVIVASQSARAPGWLLVVIVLGPLVRYENAALSAAALLWLWLAGERARALGCAALVAASLGAYSALLLSLGLEPLPTSVMAKSAAVAPESGLKSFLYALYHNVSSTSGVLMALGVVALGSAVFAPRRDVGERRLALCFAVALLMHLVVGRFGWYGRYEVYAWAAGLLVVLHLWRRGLRRWVDARSLATVGLVGLAVTGIACREYVIILANNAFASRNIYHQHYQLHRFVVDRLDEPVAVNDLGWVAFRNENHVLDLWGLASIEALEARRSSEDSTWIAPLAAEHGVRTALLYEEWFPGLPESWTRVGELRMAGPRVTPALDRVAIYALDDGQVPVLLELLRDFAESLPAGATLELEPALQVP